MLIMVKENTKMQRESIQECSQMASLWGCADKEAKLQQLALGKSQVVTMPAQVITRRSDLSLTVLCGLKAATSNFSSESRNYPSKGACPGQERRSWPVLLGSLPSAQDSIRLVFLPPSHLWPQLSLLLFWNWVGFSAWLLLNGWYTLRRS